MSVIDIHGGPIPSKPHINGEVIALLETLLEEAKSGQLTGISIAGVTPNGTTTRYTSGNYLNTVAAVTLLYHRIIRLAISEDDGP